MVKQLSCQSGTCRFQTENATQFKIHKQVCQKSKMKNVKKAPLKAKQKTKRQEKLLSEEQYLEDFKFWTVDAKYTFLWENDIMVFDREKTIQENDHAINQALYWSIHDYSPKQLKSVKDRLYGLDEIFITEVLGEKYGKEAEGTLGKSHNQYELVKNRHFLKLEEERNGNGDVSFFSILHFTNGNS